MPPWITTKPCPPPWPNQHTERCRINSLMSSAPRTRPPPEPIISRNCPQSIIDRHNAKRRLKVRSQVTTDKEHIHSTVLPPPIHHFPLTRVLVRTQCPPPFAPLTPAAHHLHPLDYLTVCHLDPQLPPPLTGHSTCPTHLPDPLLDTN